MNLADAGVVAAGLLADQLPRRWAHVQGVARAGGLIPAGVGRLVAAAGMLHDIGYSPTVVETGFHPIDGARHLRRIGCDESIVNLVAHHTCAAVEAEIRGLGDVLRDEFPFDPSLPHDELCFCDMTTSADGEPTTIDERIASIRERRAGDAPVMAFLDQSEAELRRIVAEVQAKIDQPK
jgi:hypothetical protein